MQQTGIHFAPYSPLKEWQQQLIDRALQVCGDRIYRGTKKDGKPANQSELARDLDAFARDLVDEEGDIFPYQQVISHSKINGAAHGKLILNGSQLYLLMRYVGDGREVGIPGAQSEDAIAGMQSSTDSVLELESA